MGKFLMNGACSAGAGIVVGVDLVTVHVVLELENTDTSWVFNL